MNSSSRVAIGALIILLSTVVFLVIGLKTAPLPAALAAPAALGMALGSLLIGTAVEGNPV